MTRLKRQRNFRTTGKFDPLYDLRHREPPQEVHSEKDSLIKPLIHNLTLTRRGALIILGSYIIIYCVVAYSGVMPESASYWWTDIAWTLISLLAVLKSLQTAYKLNSKREKLAWLLFAIAAFSWFIGILIWDYLELILEVTTPYPSYADYFFMLFAPLFIGGIFYYRAETHQRYTSLIQVGNIGLIASATLIITIVIQYPLIQQSQESILYISFAIAYAVVYVAAFLFALYCYWFYVWSQNRNVFLLLLLALAIHGAIDVLYTSALLGNSYGVEHYLNVFWIIAFSVQILAAVEQDYLTQQQTFANEDFDQIGSHKFEGIAPAIALLLILVTFVAFQDNLSDELLPYLTIAGLIFVLFLTIREWWLSRALHDAAAHLKDQVMERTQELSDANMQLESYSYSIAHDLRAPLRSVISFSQIVKEDAFDRLRNNEREALERIINAGKRMAELIDDILELSRITRSELKKRTVNVSKLAAGVLKEVRDNHNYQHGIVEIEPNIHANSDPRLLKVLLDNLFSNALKFTLSTEEAKIKFGIEEENGNTVYYIRDNGLGFDMRYVDKLFKPFNRLHNADKHEGTGIGLAIVQRIVQQHEGEIWVESAENQGTTFFFTLALGN